MDIPCLPAMMASFCALCASLSTKVLLSIGLAPPVSTAILMPPLYAGTSSLMVYMNGSSENKSARSMGCAFCLVSIRRLGEMRHTSACFGSRWRCLLARRWGVAFGCATWPSECYPPVWGRQKADGQAKGWVGTFGRVWWDPFLTCALPGHFAEESH